MVLVARAGVLFRFFSNSKLTCFRVLLVIVEILPEELLTRQGVLVGLLLRWRRDCSSGRRARGQSVVLPHLADNVE